MWASMVSDHMAAIDKLPKQQMSATHKRCTVCGELREHKHFYAKPAAGVNALMSKCKDCYKEQAREYQRRKREAKQ